MITTEFEPSKVARARENLTAAGLIDLVEIRQGHALQTLRSDLPDTIDHLLRDGAKALQPGAQGAQASPCPAIIMASSAKRSTLRIRSDSDFNWPQAARMSRPRGVRIGEA